MASGMKCGICLVFHSSAENDHFVITTCGHSYHYFCIKEWARYEKYPPTCPICREAIMMKSLVKLHGVSPIEPISPSTKYNFKIVLVGDSGCGKSSLLNSFDKGSFIPDKDSTVGCDVCFKTLDMAGKSIKLSVWDCGGQDRFRAITPNYLRNANGVCLVYDVTKPETLENLNDWLQLIYQYGPADVTIMLVGNKSDLESRRLIPISVGQEKASHLGFEFIESSAKDLSNVEAAFRTLVATILEGFWKDGQLDSIEMSKSIRLELTSHESPTNQSKCVC